MNIVMDISHRYSTEQAMNNGSGHQSPLQYRAIDEHGCGHHLPLQDGAYGRQSPLQYGANVEHVYGHQSPLQYGAKDEHVLWTRVTVTVRNKQ